MDVGTSIRELLLLLLLMMLMLLLLLLLLLQAIVHKDASIFMGRCAGGAA